MASSRSTAERDAEAVESLTSVNPATGEEIARFRTMSPAEVGITLDAVSDAYTRWSETTIAERTERVGRLVARLESRREEWARLMATEMGKPLAQGRAEIDKCIDACREFSAAAEGVLAPRLADLDGPAPSDPPAATRAHIVFRPLGVVLGVMPWNFPFWQVVRFAVPTLLAGNAVVIKHSSLVTGCALALEQAIQAAGFPSALFRVLLIGEEQVRDVIEHPAVHGVSLTGGVAAGRAVAAAAGAALKKSVLELGGSDPYVLFEDADIELAVEASVASRVRNSGQCCLAAKRCIVPTSLARRFEEMIVERLERVIVGDPFDEATEMGPMASRELRRRLHRQVVATLAGGARLLAGGELTPGAGAFYPPTAITDVPAGTPAYDEELFGPVIAILPVADESEALRVANDSPFGLGAAIFTRDVERGLEVAERHLEAGACAVNGIVRSDPRLPFGGVKCSGYGRELGAQGMLEFVNVKTVAVRGTREGGG